MKRKFEGNTKTCSSSSSSSCSSSSSSSSCIDQMTQVLLTHCFGFLTPSDAIQLRLASKQFTKLIEMGWRQRKMWQIFFNCKWDLEGAQKCGCSSIFATIFFPYCSPDQPSDYLSSRMIVAPFRASYWVLSAYIYGKYGKYPVFAPEHAKYYPHGLYVRTPFPPFCQSNYVTWIQEININLEVLMFEYTSWESILPLVQCWPQLQVLIIWRKSFDEEANLDICFDVKRFPKLQSMIIPNAFNKLEIIEKYRKLAPSIKIYFADPDPYEKNAEKDYHCFPCWTSITNVREHLTRVEPYQQIWLQPTTLMSAEKRGDYQEHLCSSFDCKTQRMSILYTE